MWAIAARHQNESSKDQLNALEILEDRREALSTWYAMLSLLVSSDQKPDIEGISTHLVSAESEDDGARMMEAIEGIDPRDHISFDKRGWSMVALGSLDLMCPLDAYGSKASLWRAGHHEFLPAFEWEWRRRLPSDPYLREILWYWRMIWGASDESWVLEPVLSGLDCQSNH